MATRQLIDADEYIAKINATENLEHLAHLHVELFSKSGYFKRLLANIADLPIDERKQFAKSVNELKSLLLNVFEVRQENLKNLEIEYKMQQDRLDLSLPVESSGLGALHPLTVVIEQLVAIFGHIGFQVATSNDIETDWFNFTALNVHENHPARQDHDTFYLNKVDEHGKRYLLRTHTSNTQIHAIKQHKQELYEKGYLKIIAPGRTYRNDSDATHSPMFHQLEGLYVAKKSQINIPLLNSILNYFCREFFHIADNNLRLRSSYFPFTAPSYEVDIRCDKRNNQLILGSGDQWLEILGAGVVHPNVLINCELDPDKYAALAFGMGVERLLMLKYGFADLRAFFKADLRWLKAYNLPTHRLPSIGAGVD